jgi:hypothetical protein
VAALQPDSKARVKRKGPPYPVPTTEAPGDAGAVCGREPIRAKRMDWRNFPQLVRLTTEPPGPLPILPEPEAIADLPADYPRSGEFGP